MPKKMQSAVQCSGDGAMVNNEYASYVKVAGKKVKLCPQCWTILKNLGVPVDGELFAKP